MVNDRLDPGVTSDSRTANIKEIAKEIAIGIAQANRGELIEGKEAFKELRHRLQKRNKMRK